METEFARTLVPGSAEDREIDDIMNTFYEVIGYKYHSTPMIHVMSAMLNICMRCSARSGTTKEDFVHTMGEMYQLVLNSYEKNRNKTLN